MGGTRIFELEVSRGNSKGMAGGGANKKIFVIGLSTEEN